MRYPVYLFEIGVADNSKVRAFARKMERLIDARVKRPQLLHRVRAGLDAASPGRAVGAFALLSDLYLGAAGDGGHGVSAFATMQMTDRFTPSLLGTAVRVRT